MPGLGPLEAHYVSAAVGLGPARRFAAWDRYQRVAEVVDGLGDDLLVLDVGCGPGPIARMLADRHRFVGVDIAREPLDQFARFGLAVVADALRLPFRDETFDVVLCTQTLYHLPLDGALNEIARVTRRSGYLVLQQDMLHDFSLWPQLAYWAVRRRMPGRFRLVYTTGRSRWRTIRRALDGAGFEPIRRLALEIPIGPLYTPALARRLGAVIGELPALASQQIVVAVRR
ncbi:MAG TPA: class I SAM-dependent methyltransferase [Gaiellaceae bacterium]|nr:class I SAM-dependent methyltransferase [Gaiellaceae bacterium]